MKVSKSNIESNYPDHFPPKDFWVRPETVNDGMAEFIDLVKVRSGECN